MKTDLFQSCGHCWVFQICWHIEFSTFTVSSFRTWNSLAEIPLPPPALFIVMLPKTHLILHSRMSDSRWVILLGIYKYYIILSHWLEKYLQMGMILFFRSRKLMFHGDRYHIVYFMRMKGFLCGSVNKESACNAGDQGSIPGLGRSLREGKGYPLQDSDWGWRRSRDRKHQAQSRLSKLQQSQRNNWCKTDQPLLAGWCSVDLMLLELSVCYKRQHLHYLGKKIY